VALAALTLGVSSILSALILIAFLPILENGFVNWDDDKNLLDNPHFRGLGPEQVAWAFGTLWLGVYKPLAWLLYGVEYVAWDLHPRAYHRVSLVLHAVNALAVYGLTQVLLDRSRPDHSRLARRRRALCAALAATLYAVHPLRVEVVAWASCQPYLPCTLIAILSVWCYIAGSGPERMREGRLAGAWTLYLGALLFHPVAIGLPVLYLVLDVYPLRRVSVHSPLRWRRLLLEKVPFLVLGILFAALACVARGPSLEAVEQAGPATSVTLGCYGYWFYLAKTAWPNELSAVYPWPSGKDWRSLPLALVLVATTATTVTAYVLRQRAPALLAVWLCYLILLVPNAGLVRVNDQIGADRYAYLSTIPWTILAAGWMDWLCRRSRRVAVMVALSVLIVASVLICSTRRQCRTWRDSESLWSHALSHGAASSAVAHYNLGLVRQRQERLGAAAAHYAEADRLKPNDAETLNNLGVVLQRQGKLDTAITQYAKALRVKPDYVNAHYNLGTAYSRQGRFEAAEVEYNEALRLHPSLAVAYNNLGADLLRRGRLSEAAAKFDQALRIDPGLQDARRNLESLRRGPLNVPARH
jgi:Flp pilus assembly protein TadD